MKNSPFNTFALFLLCSILMIFLACSSNSKSIDCECSVDTSDTEIRAMKDIVLNVNKDSTNQLFHVQPIIKDSTSCLVGIVALIGDVTMKDGSDSMASITFKLVHENNTRHKLNLISVTKEQKLNTDPNKPKIFTINTSTTEKNETLASYTYVFDEPRAIGSDGYKGDIKFMINDKPSTTIPRICEFIIME